MSHEAALPSLEAERFDPPVTRIEWRTARRVSFASVVAVLRASLGDAAVERVLHHRGLQLDGRPVGREDAPEELAPDTRVVAWALAREPQPIPIGAAHVLLDEAGVVAVAKPAWLPTQGTRASQRFSLEASLRTLLDCPGLHAVHRLDRETSGVTLFARSAEVASSLGRALAARRIRRVYLAVVSPPPAPCFEVGGAMVRVADPRRFRFALVPGSPAHGRPSHTRFTRLAVHADRALVRAEPTTGRTHQIRVHLAAAGFPILGDRLYGDAATPAAQRCLLHACRAELTGPGPQGRQIVIESPPPADFSAAGFGKRSAQ